MSESRDARELFRHTLATLAYRGGKATAGAPASFGGVRAGAGSRTASEILAHVCDLLDWALTYAKDGRHEWHDVPPGAWEEDRARFFRGVGQIAMLRRLAGVRVRGENYLRADIVAGRVGPEQSPPRREFE